MEPSDQSYASQDSTKKILETNEGQIVAHQNFAVVCATAQIVPQQNFG